MSEVEDTWKQIVRGLETKLTSGEFKTWFSQATLSEFSNDRAVIRVPHKFVGDWLNDQYINLLQEVFYQATKIKPEIVFSCSNRKIKSEVPRYPVLKMPAWPLGNGVDTAVTFSRFIIGDCNRFAWSTAMEVTNRKGAFYNPFYVYSNEGLGKTHLLHAIGNLFLNSDSRSRVRYISAEDFISEFSHAVREDNVQQFREFYCSLDLLLIDDIHLFSNRKKIQEEFLFIFNALYSQNKQLVISSNRPPNRLKSFESRLKSRLGWGILTDIKPPDQEIKIRIIRGYMEEEQIHIPDDVAFFLANINSDINTLRKNMIRLKHFTALNHGEVNISLMKSFIKEKEPVTVGIEDIKAITAGFFNITLQDLVSEKKERLLSTPRQIGMFLARKYTNASYKEIGEAFGNKDHSTVIYAIRRIEKIREKDQTISSDLMKLENLLH